MKYKPQTAKAHPWDEIENFYIDLNKNGWNNESIIKLVQHIKHTNLSSRLFAYTSHDKLVISIYNPIEWNREALYIEFERKYDADKGIEKFDNFIKMINW